MEYDKGCLVVWPEWGSSGIWHPKDRHSLSGPVSHVSHESLGLPLDLSTAFDRWIDWFDDAIPGSQTCAGFDHQAFNMEGIRLSKELATFVGSSYVVKFHGPMVEA
jgi:hypothetical protein